MTTPITHYSIQDFTSPYADIERLPRLTAEEEPALLHDLRFAQQAPAAKQSLRREGYTSSDSVERYLPEWEFVCLNRREHQRSSMPSRPRQRIS